MWRPRPQSAPNYQRDRGTRLIARLQALPLRRCAARAQPRYAHERSRAQRRRQVEEQRDRLHASQPPPTPAERRRMEPDSDAHLDTSVLATSPKLTSFARMVRAVQNVAESATRPSDDSQMRFEGHSGTVHARRRADTTAARGQYDARSHAGRSPERRRGRSFERDGSPRLASVRPVHAHDHAPSAAGHSRRARGQVPRSQVAPGDQGPVRRSQHPVERAGSFAGPPRHNAQHREGWAQQAAIDIARWQQPDRMRGPEGQPRDLRAPPPQAADPQRGDHAPELVQSAHYETQPLPPRFSSSPPYTEASSARDWYGGREQSVRRNHWDGAQLPPSASKLSSYGSNASYARDDDIGRTQRKRFGPPEALAEAAEPTSWYHATASAPRYARGSSQPQLLEGATDRRRPGALLTRRYQRGEVPTPSAGGTRAWSPDAAHVSDVALYSGAGETRYSGAGYSARDPRARHPWDDLPYERRHSPAASPRQDWRSDRCHEDSVQPASRLDAPEGRISLERDRMDRARLVPSFAARSAPVSQASDADAQVPQAESQSFLTLPRSRVHETTGAVAPPIENLPGRPLNACAAEAEGAQSALDPVAASPQEQRAMHATDSAEACGDGVWNMLLERRPTANAPASALPGRSSPELHGVWDTLLQRQASPRDDAGLDDLMTAADLNVGVRATDQASMPAPNAAVAADAFGEQQQAADGPSSASVRGRNGAAVYNDASSMYSAVGACGAMMFLTHGLAEKATSSSPDDRTVESRRADCETTWVDALDVAAATVVGHESRPQAPRDGVTAPWVIDTSALLDAQFVAGPASHEATRENLQQASASSENSPGVTSMVTGAREVDFAAGGTADGHCSAEAVVVDEYAPHAIHVMAKELPEPATRYAATPAVEAAPSRERNGLPVDGLEGSTLSAQWNHTQSVEVRGEVVHQTEPQGDVRAVCSAGDRGQEWDGTTAMALVPLQIAEAPLVQHSRVSRQIIEAAQWKRQVPVVITRVLQGFEMAADIWTQMFPKKSAEQKEIEEQVRRAVWRGELHWAALDDVRNGRCIEMSQMGENEQKLLGS